MLLDRLVLLFSQFPRLDEDLGGNKDLTDIVDQSRPVDIPEFMIVEDTPLAVLHLPGYPDSPLGDVFAVSFRIGVVEFEDLDHREDQLLLKPSLGMEQPLHPEKGRGDIGKRIDDPDIRIDKL